MTALSGRMKFRTFYFKVPDMKAAAAFWEGVLQVKPHKSSDYWHEFMCGSVRFGLLRMDNIAKAESNGVPVFEFSDDEIAAEIVRVKSLGAAVVVDGLSDPNMKSIVFADPFGNEFEFTTFHE